MVCTNLETPLIFQSLFELWWGFSVYHILSRDFWILTTWVPSWEITAKLQMSVGANLRNMSELGNQRSVQAQQDLFSLFPANEMHSHPFAAWEACWEQCGNTPEADAYIEGPKLIKCKDQMLCTAHKVFLCGQVKYISYHSYHQQAGLTVRNPA